MWVQDKVSEAMVSIMQVVQMQGTEIKQTKNISEQLLQPNSSTILCQDKGKTKSGRYVERHRCVELLLE